jgi:hypothetical protein
LLAATPNNSLAICGPPDISDHNVPGAAHASDLGHAPKEYQKRVIEFFEKYPEGKPKETKNETKPPA